MANPCMIILEIKSKNNITEMLPIKKKMMCIKKKFHKTEYQIKPCDKLGPGCTLPLAPWHLG